MEVEPVLHMIGGAGQTSYANSKLQVQWWNHAKIKRAVTESMLASHFRKVIMDDLFKRYAEHSTEHLSKEKTKHVTLIS